MKLIADKLVKIFFLLFRQLIREGRTCTRRMGVEQRCKESGSRRSPSYQPAQSPSNRLLHYFLGYG